MPATRSSTRKRQTRLAFTPLPSSSPAIADDPSHGQGRAAFVRYSDRSSPMKKRRLKDDDGDIKAFTEDSDTIIIEYSPRKNHHQTTAISIQAPLTPVASSQISNRRAKQSKSRRPCLLE